MARLVIFQLFYVSYQYCQVYTYFFTLIHNKPNLLWIREWYRLFAMKAMRITKWLNFS